MRGVYSEVSQQSRWTQLSRKSFSKRILSSKEIEDMDAWPLQLPLELGASFLDPIPTLIELLEGLLQCPIVILCHS